MKMVINKNMLNRGRQVCRKETITNKRKNEPSTHNDLSCDICHSQDIIETREGYTCRSCGIVLEIQKLEYHRPYNSNNVQHAPLGITQIGTAKERFQNGHSRKFNKLNKLQSFKDYEKLVLINAKCEMGRIFDILNLPNSIKPIVIKKFKKIRACLNPGTKYRTAEKLIPITIYYVCKVKNISINESKLLEVSKISKKEFDQFKLQIQLLLPHYKERDRKQYIIQKILEVSEHFNLGIEFFHQAKLILYKLWDTISSTKDDVIAGLVSSITLLCVFNTSEVTVSSICTRLGIKMSTIQFQIKNKIFEQFKIKGFTTLIQSKDLLRKVMEKMGLLKYGALENSENLTPPNIIKIELGRGVPIRCYNNEYHYFLYAIRQGNNGMVIISVKPYTSSCSFSRIALNHPLSSFDKESVFELELLKYMTSKGPPSF